MAWDLWGSSYDQVVHDSNYSEHPGWQCDFYFGCGRDVIEEDALNEKSCVQVLKILIAKEDTEIEELEKELLSLQNELAWAEHKNWPEICCSALSEKINWLDVSIRSLKNDHADNTGIQLLLQSEPAKTFHEIVKAPKRDYCQDTCGQIANTDVKDSRPGSLKHAAGHPKDEKLLVAYFSGGTQEEETKKHVLIAEDRLLFENISMHPEEKRHNPETVKGTSDSKHLGNEEVRRSQLVATNTVQILNSFSPKGKGNILKEAKQEDAIVKDVTADAFGLAAGNEGRKECLDSESRASQQAKSENSGLDQKLFDFAPKTALRDCKKESKVASALDPMNSPSNRECKRKIPLQVVNTQELCLANPELCSLKGRNNKNSPHVMNIRSASLVCAKNSVLSSLLEMQTKSALFTASQLTDEGKSQVQGLKSEITANLSKSIMSLPVKLKNLGKRQPESDVSSVRETGDSPMEVISNSSFNSTPKRQRKSRTSIDGANLNGSLNRKVKGEVQHGQKETEEYAIVPYDSKFSELQKERNVSKLPINVGIKDLIVKVGLPNSDRVAMDNGNHEDLQISRSCSLVDSNETSASQPIRLKDLTLSHLRAIAKQHNVKKYYRLAKGPLVEQLAGRLSSC